MKVDLNYGSDDPLVIDSVSSNAITEIRGPEGVDANAAVDVEYKFPFGFKEVEGIHSRTDFDLSQHEEYSGKKIRYFDPELNESYVPFVVETSIGVDRMFLQIISAAYCEEQLEKDKRVVLKLPVALAPIKLAVLPLVKKDGLPEKAREIINELKFRNISPYNITLGLNEIDDQDYMKKLEDIFNKKFIA